MSLLIAERMRADRTEAELTKLEAAVRNLIARIDRDGGHAQAGETLLQSVERAEKGVSKMLGKLDEADRISLLPRVVGRLVR